MKVLILSCNTGEGHNSAASAIREAMLKNGIECDKEDTLALVSEHVSRKVSDMYVFSTRINVFERLYKIGGTVSDANTSLFSGSIKSPVYAVNKLYGKKLYDKITSGGYDAVICTHLFPAEALTSLKKNTDLHVPVMFVMTDYTSIPFINETGCDAYVIPHRHLIEEFVSKGMSREKLFPFGIPVNASMTDAKLPKEDARRKAAELFGWEYSESGKERLMLIMGGSMGFGKVGDLVDELLRVCGSQDKIICICGRNERLQSTLASDFSDENRVKIIGYTDKVSLLLNASDVLFSKPGGITSTEAIVSNIPLIHTSPIPGLENYNALFFHYHDMSYYTEDVKEQARMAIELCDNEISRETMLSAQRRNSNPKTCEDIISLTCRMVQETITSFSE